MDQLIQYLNFIVVATMNKPNWFEMSHTLLECHIVSPLTTPLKNLPLEIFLTSSSRFSGPLALLENKSLNHQFILPERFSDCIIFLNCKGEIRKCVPFRMKDHVILFEFTKWEELLIVDASGDYWLVDPFSGGIREGSYSKKGDKDRYRGCIMFQDSNALILLKQKALGYALSPTSSFEPLPLKINAQNPIFMEVLHPTTSLAEQFAYLSKSNTIQSYNIQTSRKNIAYSSEELTQNWENLLCFGMNSALQRLVLCYSKPTACLVVVGLAGKVADVLARIQPMIDLAYSLPIGKIGANGKPQISYKVHSQSKYRPNYYQLSFLTGSSYLPSELPSLNSQHQIQSTNTIIVFSTPNLLLLSDGHSQKLAPILSHNYMVQAEIDCLRVYGDEFHQIYRIVPFLYQTLVQIEDGRVNEGSYIPKNEDIVELYGIYRRYLEGEVIDVRQMNGIGGMDGKEMRESQNWKQSGHRDEQRSDMVERLNSRRSSSSSIPPENYLNANILSPLLSAARFSLDPLTQSKIFKFLTFLKNYFNPHTTSLSPLISETCASLRMINTLKFEYLNRFITFQQFEFLKFEHKKVFLTILLRYNMHFIANLIFGDSEARAKIFMDWAKCKIEKNVGGGGASGEDIAFEEIKQKFEGFERKQRDCKVFTEIAKYCIERKKFSLAQNFIQLEQVPERKVWVYLLIFQAGQEKRIVEKILETTQKSNQSHLHFKVIKILVETTWLENHLWVNILHGKPNLERHYLNYLKFIGDDKLLNAYFVQNKKYQELGYQIMEGVIEECSRVVEGGYEHGEKWEIVEKLRQKSKQLSKLIPNVGKVINRTASNDMELQKLQILKKCKGSTEPLPFKQKQDLIKYKDDYFYEYLGEILLQRSETQLGVDCLCLIRDERVYTILQRKGKLRQALELAYSRQDKNALYQIRERCPQQMEAEVDLKIKSLK